MAGHIWAPGQSPQDLHSAAVSLQAGRVPGVITQPAAADVGQPGLVGCSTAPVCALVQVAACCW